MGLEHKRMGTAGTRYESLACDSVNSEQTP